MVPPNELQSFPAARQVMALTVRQRPLQHRYEPPPCDETIPGFRLQYSDWREDDRSSREDYSLVLAPPLSAEFRIQRIERHA
jgi:hypothetical protein